MECEPILKTFRFLKSAGFEEEIKVPNGFCTVYYYYKSIYISMGTDYREEANYFSMTLLTGKIGEFFYTKDKISNVIPETKHIYEFDIGKFEDREVLRNIENTSENYKNVIEIYAGFLKKNLTELLKLCEVLHRNSKYNQRKKLTLNKKDLECEPILKNFGFLKRAGFKELIKIPNGLCNVLYVYKSVYLCMRTDKKERNYFNVTLLTEEIRRLLYIGKIPETKHIYEFDIGKFEDREVLRNIENTSENYKNVIEIYAGFLKKNLTELLKLCKLLNK